MNLSKSEKIIFSILGVIGIGIVCNKVIYPGIFSFKRESKSKYRKEFCSGRFCTSFAGKSSKGWI